MTLPVVDECQPPLRGSALRLGVAQLLSLSQVLPHAVDSMGPKGGSC